MTKNKENIQCPIFTLSCGSSDISRKTGLFNEAHLQSGRGKLLTRKAAAKKSEGCFLLIKYDMHDVHSHHINLLMMQFVVIEIVFSIIGLVKPGHGNSKWFSNYEDSYSEASEKIRGMFIQNIQASKRNLQIKTYLTLFPLSTEYGRQREPLKLD